MQPTVLILAKGIVPDPGGIETYSDQVAQAYSALGFDVTVISCFHGPRGCSRRRSARIVNVGAGRQAMVFVRMVRAAIRYRMSQTTPTFIHATTWRAAVPALMLFPRVPLVISVHGREVTEMSPVVVVLMRLVFRAATRVLAISRTTLEAATLRIPGLSSKAIVSWNGVGSSAETTSPEQRVTKSTTETCHILTVCRLVPRKNVEGVLRALAVLNETGCTAWNYSIAGGGPDYEHLVRTRDDLGLRNKVRFRGTVTDQQLVDLYRSADIFVHPQTSGRTGRDIEGFGLAIADAMAWGLPVIVGRDGAPGEYISHGITGYVVNGADFNEIATTLKFLIQNRDVCTSVGRAAAEWVNTNLTWTRHVNNLVEALGLT